MAAIEPLIYVVLEHFGAENICGKWASCFESFDFSQKGERINPISLASILLHLVEIFDDQSVFVLVVSRRILVENVPDYYSG